MRARLAILVAAFGTCSLAGCTKNTVAPPVAAANSPQFTIPASQKIVKKEPGPPIKPSPELCLRAGEVKESLADEAKDKTTRDTMYQHAKLAYQQALDQDAKFRPAKVRLARVNEKTGQAQVAVELLQECIKEKPDDAGIWYELGMCYGRQKHWDSSIHCLRKAATLEPGNVTYVNHVGFSLARAGRLDESFEHFRATVGEAQAHLNLAKMTQHLGRTDEARQHAVAALRVEPNNPQARLFLERISQDQGVVQASAPAP